MKTRYLLIVALIACISCLLILPSASAATYYADINAPVGGDGSSANPFRHIQSGVSVLQPGDTLIIRDGTYYGTSTTSPIIDTVRNGNANGWITIKAENDFQVILDGTGHTGVENSNVRIDNSYHRLEGIVSINAPGPGIQVSGTDHVKILRCGSGEPNRVGHASSAIGISGSSYVLVEGCFAWGESRYQIGISSSGTSSYNVFRGNLARFDYSESDEPKGSFASYKQHSTYFFNNIAIDGVGYLYNMVDSCDNDITRGFVTPKGFDNVELRGNLVLNFEGNGYYFEGGDSETRNLILKDNIAWDLKPGRMSACPPVIVRINSPNIDGSNGLWYVGHNTFGSSVVGSGLKTKGYSGPKLTLLDSIYYSLNVYGIGDEVIDSSLNSDYSLFYGNTINYGSSNSVGDHDWSAENGNSDFDPTINNLKYLVKIEDGNTLDGAASDGGDVGATMMYQIGCSECAYGEPGWDQLQPAEPLWPWKNEGVIEHWLCSFHSTDHPEIEGNRGFCNWDSLTDYVWSYLGNYDHPYHDGYTPVCGNGIVDQGEQCDDGNTNDGDGCDSDCNGECIDLDSDGFGSPASSYCDDLRLDCLDSDFFVNPGVAEVCSNGKDDDCNPLTGDTEGVCSVYNIDGSQDGIDISDLILVAQDFHSTPTDYAGGSTDVNGDGRVDILDLVLVATHFTQ